MPMVQCLALDIKVSTDFRLVKGKGSLVIQLFDIESAS